MANQHPMRAQPPDGTERYGADTVAAREAMRISEREEAQSARGPQRSAMSGTFVAVIAVLLAILSAIAVWLKS